MFQPAYLTLLDAGELDRRADAADALYGACRVCPHACGVDRLHDERGICGVGAQSYVASHTLHFGEEPVISGTGGSGTIFFGNCNLRCMFCQNYEISQRPKAMRRNEVTGDRLAGMMLELQDRGAHNINFVSPSHVVPSVICGIAIAARKGLRLPLVYNSNGYDSPDSLALLDGLIDIYLPDLKYGDNAHAVEFSAAPEYTRHAHAAIREMYRQVGLLQLGPDGLAQRGLIVRHLVMPRNVSRTGEVLTFIARELSPLVSVSLMAQYYPTNRAVNHAVINRCITADEYDAAVETAEALGLVNGWFQQPEAEQVYRPDFQREEVFLRSEIMEP